MTDLIQKANLLIKTSPRTQIDIILATLGVTQEEYRKHYPDTPITAAFALDLIDAKEIDGLSNEDIMYKWNLSKSQLNYALYNNKAIVSHEINLVRLRVETALRKTNKSQTEIAEENGISQPQVHSIAKELGLLPVRKKRISLTEQQWATILESIANGTPVDLLAKQYNISRDTIYKKVRSSK